MSLAAVFEYEVERVRAEAFETVYGPDGEWARFFAPVDDYLDTELLRSVHEGAVRYLVIDRWRSAASYDAFSTCTRTSTAAATRPRRGFGGGSGRWADSKPAEARGACDTSGAGRRRARLVVPAAPAAKLAKGVTLAASEVVLDPEGPREPAHAASR